MRTAAIGLVSLLAACSEAPPPSLLDPPAAGQGVQYKMVTRIEAGHEVEHCQFFTVPAEGLNVSRTETRFTSGSHHVLLYLTPYKSIPTKNDRGQAVDTSGVFDCSSGATDGWSVTTLVGGSQNSDGEGPVEFPPGVAMPVPGGAVVMMNAHYINASPSPLEPEIRMNMYSVPSSEVQIVGGLLFWYNVFIKVDAQGSGVARMSCPITEDITLVSAQSHMHRRGVGFESVAQVAGAQQPLFATDAWERVPVGRWPAGLKVGGGSRIEFHCDYQNSEARTVWQGPRSTDEMCAFAAAYYPARPQVSFCSSEEARLDDTRFLAANWVGSGNATCAQTLGCLQKAGQSGMFFQGLTECVLGAAPAASPLVSDMVRCIVTHDDPIASCGPQIGACSNG
jgi:hypothetical protein